MFEPDYRNLVDCAYNRKPRRIPLYEHNVNAGIIERITGQTFVSFFFEQNYKEFFKPYCKFFLDYGYDAVTYESCVTEFLPYGGALSQPRTGYIDSMERYLSYPFEEAVRIYIERSAPRFDALRACMPKGMKAVGGVGNGVFEIVQDLCGFENLCILKYEEPEIFEGIFRKAGDMLVQIWTWFLREYGDIYCVARFGDDLGYKTGTLLSPQDIREYILPQYRRVISLIHEAGLPFLLHSCGNIFEVMPDIIACGIDAKHSNEDQIADMEEWVRKYGDKIGNFGGIDTDHLVRMDNILLEKEVSRIYALAEKKAGGFAIGSGNSIPDYVDCEKYLLMIDTVRRLRGDFGGKKI